MDEQPPSAGPWRGASQVGAAPRSGPEASGPWARRPLPSAESSEGALGPTVPRFEPRLASLSARVLAKSIDAALLALAAGPGAAALQFWRPGVGWALLLLAVLGVAGFQWTITASSGQSLGKRWAGLRVITQTGGRVGFVHGVALRAWVIWLIGGLSGGLALLVDPLFALGKRRKALHDHLAGTLVIIAETPGDPYAKF